VVKFKISPFFFMFSDAGPPVLFFFGCPPHKNLLSLIAQKMLAGLILCNFPAFVKTAVIAYRQKVTPSLNILVVCNGNRIC